MERKMAKGALVSVMELSFPPPDQRINGFIAVQNNGLEGPIKGG
jgi:hypothetical protein